MGACRRQELYDMRIDDVRDLSSSFLVVIPTRKVKIKREFTITGNYYDIVKKYIDLRPETTKTDSFFIKYNNGKCTLQRVGIHKFCAMGKQVAFYLNKPNPEQYSALTFCKSSTTMQLMSDDEDSPEYTPSEIDETATSVISSQNSEDEESPNSSVLPKKSAKRYEEVYNMFLEWQQKKRETSFSEDVLSEYFEEQSLKYNPSSLWTFFSMLRSTIELHHNININDYSNLRTSLKGKLVKHGANKATTFSTEDIDTFIKTAPDYKYLATKVSRVVY